MKITEGGGPVRETDLTDEQPTARASLVVWTERASLRLKMFGAHLETTADGPHTSRAVGITLRAAAAGLLTAAGAALTGVAAWIGVSPDTALIAGTSVPVSAFALVTLISALDTASATAERSQISPQPDVAHAESGP